VFRLKILIAQLQTCLPDSVAVLERMLKQGHSVYVHCSAGVNRSPTVVAAYLHWWLGYELFQARRRSMAPVGRAPWFVMFNFALGNERLKLVRENTLRPGCVDCRCYVVISRSRLYR